MERPSGIQNTVIQKVHSFDAAMALHFGPSFDCLQFLDVGKRFPPVNFDISPLYYFLHLHKLMRA